MTARDFEMGGKVQDRAKFRVKAVADGLIPSVELVLAKPLEWLASQGHLEYSLEVISDVDVQADLAAYDLLILMRACMPSAMELVEAAITQEIPVIYAIDDDFEALDPDTPLGRYYRENNAWERLLAICSKCDQVWAFSEALKQKITRVQDKVVIPPAIAGLEWIERELASRLQASPADDVGKYVIGYGASRYHNVDLDSVSVPLLALLNSRDDVYLELIGVSSESLIGHPKVSHFQNLPSIDDYYRFAVSRNWTCGIAPLVRSPANDAKTDNKYREFAALGVPAVYSDAPAYKRSIINDYNGVVAVNSSDWQSGLERLINDARYRDAIARNARGDVRSRYSIGVVSRHYLNLMRSALQRPLQVLVYAAPIPTTDIDITRPFSRLRAEGKVEWTLVPYGEQPLASQLQGMDLLVVSRVHDPSVRELISRAKQDFAIPSVFSWDDDFFSIPESLGGLAKHHSNPKNIQSLKEILSEVDLVKASTPKLFDRTREYTDRVVMAPYGFDFDQIARLPNPTKRSSAEVVIGFFGGASHGPSVEMLTGALRKVAALAPHVRFEFFGPKTPSLEALPRASFIAQVSNPEHALAKLRSLAWDIGLAPLEINEFNRAKLPTKYRDYGACHIAGVYTRLDPYTAVVEDGVTGLLADNNEQAWVEAIMRLVDDQALCRSMAANAHAHVRNELSLDQSAEAWREIFDRFSPTALDPVEQLEREQKRVRALELRVAHLSGQVEALRTAAGALLHAHLNPFPPAATWLGRLRRYLYRRLRDLGGAAPYASVSMPDPTSAVTALARVKGDWTAEMTLLRGPNLAGIPYVEYPMPLNESGSILRLPSAALVPGLNGYLGVELVTPDDRIHCHVVVPVDQMDPGQVAVFRIPFVHIDREGWRIRCFVRNSASPLYPYLVGDSHFQTLLFSIEPDNRPSSLPIEAGNEEREDVAISSQ